MHSESKVQGRCRAPGKGLCPQRCPLGLLSQWPRMAAATRGREVRSACPTPSRGKWPSLNVDVLTVALPSSPRTGCCPQPTAKRGMQAGLRVLGGARRAGSRDLGILGSGRKIWSLKIEVQVCE